eukprot:TRINITY_DN14120_c0_g1_i1.p1 TRINITY_DN14120_c0_g1~~TRINITY_DN14120_c0_g1_i1.p1  ORF type:complete len:172 (+),score=37.61 TRINITY_DN14120_c0_g1_i1:54-518(+)
MEETARKKRTEERAKRNIERSKSREGLVQKKQELQKLLPRESLSASEPSSPPSYSAVTTSPEKFGVSLSPPSYSTVSSAPQKFGVAAVDSKLKNVSNLSPMVEKREVPTLVASQDDSGSVEEQEVFSWIDPAHYVQIKVDPALLKPVNEQVLHS